MLIREEQIRDTRLSDTVCHLKTDAPLFFDIETTGLGWRSSHAYLIGVLFRRGSVWILRQYFLDHPFAEKELLQEFSAFLKTLPETTAVHYNGSTFDIPYLRAKYAFYGLPLPLQLEEGSLDLLTSFRPLKTMLGLPGMKQKDLETFLGIPRKDRFSGGQLISLYQEYLQSGSEELLDLFYLHNEEDVLGMTGILPLYALRDLQMGKFLIRDKAFSDQAFRISLELSGSVPMLLFCQNDLYRGVLEKDLLQLEIPLKKGEMKHFFKDWKNYYYFPEEDQALHKSVAQFAEKDHRVKASARTCYQRFSGTFLPQFGAPREPAFYESLHAIPAWASSSDSRFSDPSALHAYCMALIQNPLFRLTKKDPAQ